MDGNLRAFLEAKAHGLEGPGRALYNVDSVYRGERDSYKESVCQAAYDAAKIAAEEWLRHVLLAELSETSADSARAELTVPCGCIEQEIYANGRALCGGDIFAPVPDACCAAGQETVYTSIGKMSGIAYEAVTAIMDNPIALIYRYFAKQLALLHGYCGEGLLTEASLRGHGVRDVFGVHQMEVLYRDLKSLFRWVDIGQPQG